jgi:RES domain
VNLRGFPRRTLRGDRTVYRIHRATRHPWWFSFDGNGRFDPIGTGHGACYLAERPLGSFVDAFRKPMVIAEPTITPRALLTTELGRDLRLADLTSRRARLFDVTASLGANEHYTASQRFAAAAVQAGYDGVRYLVRHDPAQRLYGIALFGPEGQADPADPAWPVSTDGPLPDELLAEAQRAFHYRILPAP